MASPIDTSASWPGDNMNVDNINLYAMWIRDVGSDVSTTSGTVATKWSGLGKSYHAPEQQSLLGAMKPASTLAGSFASDLDKAATALETFATELQTIQNNVSKIRADANTFLAGIHDGKVTTTTHVVQNRAQLEMGTSATVHKDVDWDSDQATVDANNALIHRVNDQAEQLEAAERKCANAIRDIYGAPHIAPITASNPGGFGYTDIPDNAKTPWGSAVSRKEGCGEKTADSVIGGFGDVLGGLGQGVTGLVGVDWNGWHPNWSWSNLGNNWFNLSKVATGLSPFAGAFGFLPGPVGGYFKDSQKLATQAVTGLVGIDPYSSDPFAKWKRDPVRTGTSSVLNVASFFIPGGGEANAGAKGASTAAKATEVANDASKAGKAADVVGDAGKAADAVDAAKIAQDVGKGDVAATADLGKTTAHIGDDVNGLGKTDIDIPNAPHENVNVDHPSAGDHPGDAPDPRDPGQSQGDTSGTGPGHSGYNADGKWQYAHKADPSWNNVQKGVYGEQAADEFMKSQGTTRLDTPHSSVTSNGIDGIYRASDGHVIVVESKYGSAGLKSTSTGRQMSDSWLLSDVHGEPRIDLAVDNNRALAREITDAIDNGDVTKLLVHTDANGIVNVSVLDADGFKIPGAVPKF
jgi:hypothetical protein